MKSYIFLFLAILSEIFGTTFLKKSEGFTKLLPAALSVLGIALAFYFLSIAVRTIPVGIAYAIWSGIGIVFITIIGIIFFKQQPDVPAIIGLSLIVIGVIVINLFSKMGAH